MKPLNFYLITLLPNFPCRYVKIIKEKKYLGKFSISDTFDKFSTCEVYSCKILFNHYEVVLQ